MEIFTGIELGFATALSFQNLSYCFAGALLGTMIGVLPGLGPVATIALLLPLTFALPSTPALIMLAGIYYGAQYGGSTTAILINVPGESSSVVTALDGYQMARKGRAGAALAIAALGSFFAGTVATFLLALFAPPLAEIALTFGPAEYFSLMVVGLIASVTLASGSVLKALAMVVLGLLLGLTGQDIYSGMPRLTFGSTTLIDGYEFVAVAMGIFGLGEIIRNLEDESRPPMKVGTFSSLMPSREEFRRSINPILRGTALGSLLGILPGGGALLSSFASYSMEKKLSDHPEEFGQGAVEGVAGPESANNAGAQTSFIPMLTLGIPSNPVMALMIGAMIIQGITPGPDIITNQPDLFWGLIASMWVGNFMLVLLNLPLIGMWVRLVTVPYHILFPIIVVVCCIGVFSAENNIHNVTTMAVFGAAGYLLAKLDFEPAPFLLGFVIGPMVEEYLRRAMLLSDGDPTIFITRPISAGLLVLAVIALAVVALPSINSARDVVFRE